MAVSDGPASRAAVRVINQTSCGSGSICGKHPNGGSIILTNAHVAGTKIGREVSCEAIVNGQTKKFKATVIMAAYSDATLSDWAILHAPDFNDIEPVKLSKNLPSGSHYTKGCPRCVWPPVATDVTTVEIDDDSPLWRWNPASIGGQSGSAVWSDENHIQYGILTWLWGGKGAGQTTYWIRKQAMSQSTVGYPRPPGLTIPQNEPLPPGTPPGAQDEPTVEEGFFAQVSIVDLPIWHEDALPPPDPGNPDSTRKLIVDFLGAAIEFMATWRERFLTEKEKTGPGAPPAGSGGTFGL